MNRRKINWLCRRSYLLDEELRCIGEIFAPKGARNGGGRSRAAHIAVGTCGTALSLATQEVKQAITSTGVSEVCPINYGPKGCYIGPAVRI
jgi:hypothetical protein